MIFNWIVDRLAEKSTYAGIVAVVSLLMNKTVDGDLVNAITTAGMAIAGVLAVVMRETNNA